LNSRRSFTCAVSSVPLSSNSSLSLIAYSQIGANMDVNKITTYAGQKPPKMQEVDNKNAEQNKSTSPKDVSQSERADRVELSKEYQELSKVKKVTMELSDIRTERVDQVRKMIANNTYSVEPAKIADKMLEELI
jgi:flagellar biosynthesis anti-sigma factor FlgM